MQRTHYPVLSVETTENGYDLTYKLADGTIAKAQLLRGHPSWNTIRISEPNEQPTILIGAHNHSLLKVQTLDGEILETRLRL